MKRFFLPLFLLLPIFAFSLSNRDLPKLSSFRLWGEHILYERADFSKDAEWHRIFNHEGGLNLKVLEKGDFDKAKNGTWYYVLLQRPVYVETGELLQPYTKFWIFLRDDEEIFDYEEF